MSQSHRVQWWSDPRQWLRALLMLDDTPHSIALGAAIGVFVAFTPTVGVQMLVVLLIAGLTRPLFRFNRVAALIAVYISNPLTMVPLYWFNYTIGRLYFPSTMSREEFAEVFQYRNFAEWWDAVTLLFVDLGVPLVAGSLIVGGACGIVTYPLMLRLLRRVPSQQPDQRRSTPGGALKETVKQQPLGA